MHAEISHTFHIKIIVLHNTTYVPNVCEQLLQRSSSVNKGCVELSFEGVEELGVFQPLHLHPSVCEQQKGQIV